MDLTPVLIVFFICGSIYLIFELFVCREERKMFISKIGELKDFDVSKLLAPVSVTHKTPSVLACGCVAVGIGLGLLAASGFRIWYDVYDMNMSWSLCRTIESACVCIFGGLGFIVAFILGRRYGK